MVRQQKLLKRKQQLKKVAEEQQRQALNRYYQQLQAKEDQTARQKISNKPKPVIKAAGNDKQSRDICAGNNRFLETCR